MPSGVIFDNRNEKFEIRKFHMISKQADKDVLTCVQK